MSDWLTLAATSGFVFFMVSVFCLLDRIAKAVERMRENSDRMRQDMEEDRFNKRNPK